MIVEREVSFKLVLEVNSQEELESDFISDDAISCALEQFEISLAKDRGILSFDLTEERF